MPALGSWLAHGDVTGWAGVAWFALNPSYAARPHNSGNALLRYVLHGELSVLGDAFSVSVDGVMFTDRNSRSWARPSELDLTLDAFFRQGQFELHFAYEEDRSPDRRAVDSHRYFYVLLVVAFDARTPPWGVFTPFGATNAPVSP